MPESGRTYIIINQQSNTCMDLSGQDQRSVIGYRIHRGDNQQWTFEECSGAWTIQNRRNGEFLDADVQTVPSNGERVVTSRALKRWVVRWDDQFRGFRFFFLGSNFNINLSNHGSSADGTPITIWGEWPGQNQVWRLEEI